jgi:hypothetical protein
VVIEGALCPIARLVYTLATTAVVAAEGHSAVQALETAGRAAVGSGRAAVGSLAGRTCMWKR